MKESVIQGEPPRTVRRRLGWSRRILKASSVCRQGRGRDRILLNFLQQPGGPETGTPKSLLKCKFSKKTGKTVR